MVEKAIDLIFKIIDKITEPFMMVSLIMIIGLFYLLILREKGNKALYLAMEEHSKGLSACNNSICGMLPLLEVLVYGKGGKKG